MTANLPGVGAAQAVGSAGPAFPAIWAEAAVSITFRAQMCQPSHQPSAGCISRARQLIASIAVDSWCWVRCEGLPGTAEGQLSSRLTRPARGEAVARPEPLLDGRETPGQTIFVGYAGRKDRLRQVMRPCPSSQVYNVPGANGMRGYAL